MLLGFSIAKKTELVISLDSYTNPDDDVKRLYRVSIDGSFEFKLRPQIGSNLTASWKCFDIFS